MSKITSTNWENLVSGDELRSVKRIRNSEYEVTKQDSRDEDMYTSKGWEKIASLRKGRELKFRRIKPVWTAFEDAVWMMFLRLGFKTLNRDGDFVMRYGTGPNDTQQIDVFAVDDDSVFIVECKATEERKLGNFKKPIEAFIGMKDALAKEALTMFPKRKVHFIWAQSNFFDSQADIARLMSAGIRYFDDDTVTYFSELAAHLGKCAKFQFLARMNAFEKIPGFECRVPAIKSKLGKYTCYNFLIEPDRLLQIGYILHHHSANDNLMPAYQRLIKKSRLVKIREFVEGGGYFANSLIISIDTGTEKKGLKFVPNGQGIDGCLSTIGVLHLPARYCSAYIIDGQHRLYAYSGSELSKKQTVPVVAFENLDKHEQLQLFMDINENQKSVPKTLRATLNADMLWNSPNMYDQRLAIASKIPQLLEGDKKSALYGRIVVGENETQKARQVTITAIQVALQKSGLLDVYSRSGELLQSGSLDFGDSDKTKEKLYEVLSLCFWHISELCPKAWKMTEENRTIVVTNRGIQGIIRVIGDVVKFLADGKHIKDPKKMSSEDLVQEIVPMLEPLCDYFESSDDTRSELRSAYGTGADTKYWHHFQKIIHDKFPQFNPDGLSKYLRDETKQYNDSTRQNIEDVTEAVKRIVDDNLFVHHPQSNEQLKLFPKNIYSRLKKQVSDYEWTSQTEDVDFKQFVTLADLHVLVTTSPYWVDIFEPLLSMPGIPKNASKKNKTAWMDLLESEMKKLSNPAHSVSAETAMKIADVGKWLLKEEE